jgi:DNA-binding response OmpR family regulator
VKEGEAPPVPEPTRILIVDDDAGQRAAVASALAEERALIAEAGSGAAALRALASERVDLVVCELVLPDYTGLGLCRLIRENPALAATPILMVASRCEEIDRILAFECGVDDFLRRPFYPRELLSRVRAVLRRGRTRADPGASGSPGSADACVELDPATRSAHVLGRRVDLTPREFDLLFALVRDPDRVITREQLLESAWGARLPRTQRTVDAHMKSVRRKLGPARDCVETVRGVGYRFSQRRAPGA